MSIRPPVRSHICLSCQKNLTRRTIVSEAKKIYFPNKKKHHGYKSRRIDMLAARELAGRRMAARAASTDEFNGPFDKSTKNLPRFYGRHGSKKIEDVEDLEMPLLGDSAKVIVLRDSLVTTYTPDSFRSRSVEPQHIDIVKQLKAETGLVGEDEVQRNIESLRPLSTELLQDWQEMNDLVEKIQSSFTTAQLETYIDRFAPRQSQHSINSSSNKLLPGSLVKVTRWRPGISDTEESFDDHPLRGYAMTSHTLKQRMALCILRECWDIELQQIADGVGQFEIQLLPGDLEVLLAGPTPALNTLQSDLLPLEHEKLEIFRSRAVIRISSVRSKKDWIVQKVQDLTKNIERTRLAIHALYPYQKMAKNRRWAEQVFDELTRKELEDMTKVRIKQTKDDILELTCLTRGNFDTRISAARRLLLMAGDYSGRSELRLASTVASNEGGFSPYPFVDGMNWWARLRGWARWTAPVSKEHIATMNNDGTEQAMHQEDGDDEVSAKKDVVKTTNILAAQMKITRRGPKLQREDDPWSVQHTNHTCATMGAVIHQLEPSASLVGVTEDQQCRPAMTAFSTTVPNLSRLISTSRCLHQGHMAQNLVLRFQPDPFHILEQSEKKKTSGFHDALVLPIIEIHLSKPDSDKEWTLEQVQAVIADNHLAVMLPENSVDIRFEQKSTSLLLEKDLPQIKSYIQKCVLDQSSMQIWHSITLPISQHLCQNSKSSARREHGLNDKLQTAVPNNVVHNVAYLFSSVQLQKTLSLRYKDWDLSYIDINAGKSGGKRGELRIHSTKNNVVMAEKEFVKIAYEIVDVLGGGTLARNHTDTGEDTSRLVRAVQSDAIGRPIARRVQTNTDGPTYRYSAKRIDLVPERQAETNLKDSLRQDRS